MCPVDTSVFVPEKDFRHRLIFFDILERKKKMLDRQEINSQVCVIIPVYNREEKIKRCINSIINQTYYNIEVVVVDDASTDNTVNVIRDIIKTDNRIRLISLKNNGGVGKARNEGIKCFFNSTSDYVSFVDSDDFIHFVFDSQN